MNIQFFTGLVFLLVTGTGIKAQLGRDYLCLDKKLKLQYTDKQGNLFSMQYKKMFIYQGTNGNDTCYLYQRIRLNGENKGYKSNLLFKANGNVLVECGYVYSGDVNENDPHEHRITIVKPGEEKVETNTTGFDMSIYTFEITTTYLPSYTLPNGLEFKDVIRFDQYNKADDFHYITYIAKGQGIIDQGEGETRRVK